MKSNIVICWAVAAILSVAASAGKPSSLRIESQGEYPPHLQGVCTDGKDIWWSHTVELTRTDKTGKVLAHVKKLESHHGDLCVVDGIVYVAVNLGDFNTEDKADSWVYAYRGEDLGFIKRWKVPELRHGVGGMTYKDGKFFIIGGLPPTHNRNYVYEYTPDFVFVERHILECGWTNLGIQIVDYADGKFVFGCYGGKNRLTGERKKWLTLVTDADFKNMQTTREEVSVGCLWLDGRRWKGTMKLVDKKAKGSRRRYNVALEPVKSAELK